MDVFACYDRSTVQPLFSVVWDHIICTLCLLHTLLIYFFYDFVLYIFSLFFNLLLIWLLVLLCVWIVRHSFDFNNIVFKFVMSTLFCWVFIFDFSSLMWNLVGLHQLLTNSRISFRFQFFVILFVLFVTISLRVLTIPPFNIAEIVFQLKTSY